MTSPRATRLIALLLSFLPGWGHIYLHREGRGLLVFTAWAALGFVFANAAFLYRGEQRELVAVGSGLFALGLLAYAIIDVAVLTSPARRRRVQRLQDQLLWEGMLQFLGGQFLAAERKFLECFRLDRLGVEGLFRAGVAASRHGDSGRARRWLVEAGRLDRQEKWSWEIRHELAALASASAPAPAPRDTKAAAVGEAAQSPRGVEA